jgi:hypothetical protein
VNAIIHAHASPFIFLLHSVFGLLLVSAAPTVSPSNVINKLLGCLRLFHQQRVPIFQLSIGAFSFPLFCTKIINHGAIKQLNQTAETRQGHLRQQTVHTNDIQIKKPNQIILLGSKTAQN